MRKKKAETRPVIEKKKPQVSKACFFCDGTGEMCNVCGESEAACWCEVDRKELIPHEECDGTGRVMVDMVDDA